MTSLFGFTQAESRLASSSDYRIFPETGGRAVSGNLRNSSFATKVYLQQNWSEASDRTDGTAYNSRAFLAKLRQLKPSLSH